ncbi:MAG TPA: hypothetical protein PKM43_20280, partial [Verrucomicrobiota bacterium]|nr:hypothetical protein [Verrucomicrobiota bacterium]
MTEDLRKAVAEIVARSPDEVQGNGLYALLVRMGARHLRGETPFCQDDEYAKLIFPTVLKPIVCMLSAELQAWLGKGGNREPHDIRKSTAEDSNLSDSDRFLIGQTQQPAALQDGLSMLNGWFFESGTTGPIWAKALLRVEREPRETRDKKAAGFLITAGIRWLKGEVHMDDAEAFLDEQVREALSRKKEVFETIVTPAFSARDIADWESLREKLIERSDPVSKWLWDQLAVGTQDKLTRLEPDDRTLQAALLDDLNRILREPCIHGNECFQAIQLRDETERRLSVNPQGDALVRLNRLLLEDAYPKAVSRLSNRVATAYGLFGRSYSIMGPAEDVAAFARTLGLRKIELRKARRPRSSTFSVSDLVDLPSLAAKLKLPSRAFDTWFAAQLSSVTQAALANYQGQGFDPVPLQEALVKDFNKLLLQASIYNEQRFAGIDLRSETQTVMLQNPQGNDLQRLNRLLIEDAYPLEVSRNQHIA